MYAIPNGGSTRPGRWAAQPANADTQTEIPTYRESLRHAMPYLRGKRLTDVTQIMSESSNETNMGDQGRRQKTGNATHIPCVLSDSSLGSRTRASIPQLSPASRLSDSRRAPTHSSQLHQGCFSAGYYGECGRSTQGKSDKCQATAVVGSWQPVGGEAGARGQLPVKGRTWLSSLEVWNTKMAE